MISWLLPAIGALRTAWRIVSSPLGRMVFPALLALAVGFHQGWSIKSRLDVSATLRSQIAAEQDARKKAEQAALNDRKLAEAAEAERKKQEERANDLEAKVSAGVCFPQPDADQLRNLWRL